MSVTTYPLLRWTLPKGERNEVVYIARKPARAASGEFVTENLDDTAPMTGRAGSHRTTNGLYAGTHYWLVVTRNADFEQQYSRIGRFRVAPSLSVTRARLTPGATAGSADFRMRLKTNARSLRVTIKVVQGGKVVQTFARTSKVLNPGVWGSRKVHWVPSSAASRNPAQRGHLRRARARRTRRWTSSRRRRRRGRVRAAPRRNASPLGLHDREHGADDQDGADHLERPASDSPSTSAPSAIATTGFTYWCVTTVEIGRCASAYP